MILKITQKEIINTLKKVYKINDIKFMSKHQSEKDQEIVEMFDYVEGVLNEKRSN